MISFFSLLKNAGLICLASLDKSSIVVFFVGFCILSSLFIFIRKELSYRFVFPILAALKMLIFWVIAAFRIQQTDFAVVAVLRRTTAAYFPVITALANFRLDASYIFENVDSRFFPYPVFASAVHSFFYAIFSSSGLIVADMVIVVCFYYSVYYLLRAAKIHPFVSGSVSLLLLSGSLGGILNVSLSFFSFGNINFVQLWGLTLYRPFVSEIPFFLFLCFLLKVNIRNGRYNFKYYIAIGAFLSLLLQTGDLWGSMAMSFLWGGYYLYLIIRERKRRFPIFKMGWLCLLTFLVVTSPFFMQRLCEQDAMSIRLGVFPVVNGTVSYIWQSRFIYYYVWFFVFCMVAIVVQPKVSKRKIYCSFFALLFFLSLSCLFLLPMTCLFLKKNIQYFHYYLLFIRMISYSFVFAISCCLDATIDFLRKRKRQISKVFSQCVFFVVVIVSIFYSVEIVPSYFRRHWPNASTYNRYHWKKPDKKELSYIQLFKFLSGIKNDNTVLGGVDRAVVYWWTAFKQGYSFFGSGSAVSVSDEELDKRLVLFFKIMGYTADEFYDVLNKEPFDYDGILFLLYCFKYHVDEFFTLDERGAYSEDIQRMEFKRRGTLDTKLFVMSDKERNRLRNLYVETSSQDIHQYKLDLMVLPKDGRFVEKKNLEKWGDIVFENDYFRVWQRSD